MSHFSPEPPAPWRSRGLAALFLAWGSGSTLLGPAAALSAEDHPGSTLVEARIEDGRLTIQADGAPLADVLSAIGAAGGFPVVVRGDLDAPVTASFTDQPLENGIHQLIGRHTLIVMRADSKLEPGASKLTEVRVIQNRDADARAGDMPQLSAPADDQDDAEAVEDQPSDRASFRAARRGVPPTTRDDILFELSASDEASRVAAISKVGGLPQRDAIEVLSSVFMSDEDITVRSRAVAALTRLDGPAARNLLRDRALGSDEDSSLRAQALNALTSMEGPRAFNVLVQALRQDPEPKVRLAAVRAFGRAGGDWARSALKRAARDPDPEISLAAEHALADLPSAD